MKSREQLEILRNEAGFGQKFQNFVKLYWSSLKSLKIGLWTFKKGKLSHSQLKIL